MEAVRTNVLGAENVLSAAIAAGRGARGRAQHRQGGLSDQRHGHVQGDDGEGDGRQVAADAEPARPVICATRYGNVMASRGSVIPLFVEQMQGRPAADHHRPEHDALPDVARGLGRPRALRLRARPAGRHLRAEGAGVDRRRPGAGAARAVRAATTRSRSSAPVTARSSTSRWCRARRWRAAEDLGHYYRIPADGRDLNYDKYFVEGETAISRSWTTTPRTTRERLECRSGVKEAAAEARLSSGKQLDA